MRSSLCTSLTAFPTSVWRSHKDNVRKATVEEQLSSETIHPAMSAHFHLPVLDLSWALRWKKMFGNVALDSQSP